MTNKDTHNNPSELQLPVVPSDKGIGVQPGGLNTIPVPQAHTPVNHINSKANSPQTPVQLERAKPPLAAQIIFGVSAAFALLVMLMIAYLVVVSNTKTGKNDTALGLILTIVGFTAVFLFLNLALAWFVRQGKLWALTVYSILLGLSTLSEIASILNSGAEQLLGNAAFIVITIVQIALIVNLWTSHRSWYN